MTGKKVCSSTGEEKTFAPPMLQIGAVVDGTQYNDVRFAFGARLTFLDLGGYRSEWRTDITLGATYAVESEYYRPFTPKSQWFVAPRVYASSSSVDLYSKANGLRSTGSIKPGGHWISGMSSAAAAR